MKRHRLPYAEWGLSELWAASTAVLCAQISRGPQVMELENALGRLLNVRRVFAVNAGRTALQAGLAALTKLRPERDEVIIPEFVCPAVVGVVKSLGLRPIPAEVGPDLNLRPDASRKLIGGKTLAIVVAHMYGCPAAIEQFERIASEAGVFLVDDAAQVVGEPVSGRMLGTFGDFGVLSFAQSKCIVTGESGGGGALICRNRDLLPILEAHVESLVPAESRFLALVSFVWNYLLAPYTNQMTYYWRRLWRSCVASGVRSLPPRRISNLDAKIALCQLASLSRRREERIRALGQYAHELSRAGNSIRMPQFAPGRYLARVIVSIASPADLEACQQLLRQKSMQTRRGYPTYSDGVRSVQSSEPATRRLIELPLYSRITNDDVIEVCKVLQEVVCASRMHATMRTDHDEHCDQR